MDKTLSLSEAKKLIKYVIENNKLVHETNQTPIAVGLESPPGIGKTTLVSAIADELNMDLVMLNLAQLDELGDLVGLPLKEYELCKETGECTWVPEKTIGYYQNNTDWVFTGNTRTNYSKPFWFKENSTNGILLCLDDYNRAAPKFLSACMELINKQEYYSWKLPTNSQIILTNNPDDGNFSVFSMDSAQKTRFLEFKIKFDIDSWVQWAVNTRVDERCVAFVQHNHTSLFPQYYGDSKNGSTHPVNPRVANMFFNSLKSIKDYSSQIELISSLAQATIGNAAAPLFLQFVSQGLDKIFTSEQLLDESFTKVEENLATYVSKVSNTKYRTDIAAIVADRVLNELLYRYVSKKDRVKGSHRKRLLELLNSDYFSVDIKNKIVNNVLTNFALNAFIDDTLALELRRLSK